MIRHIFLFLCFAQSTVAAETTLPTCLLESHFSKYWVKSGGKVLEKPNSDNVVSVLSDFERTAPCSVNWERVTQTLLNDNKKIAAVETAKILLDRKEKKIGELTGALSQCKHERAAAGSKGAAACAIVSRFKGMVIRMGSTEDKLPNCVAIDAELASRENSGTCTVDWIGVLTDYSSMNNDLECMRAAVSAVVQARDSKINTLTGAIDECRAERRGGDDTGGQPVPGAPQTAPTAQ